MEAYRQSTSGSIRVGPVLDADGAFVSGAVIGDFEITKPGSAAAAFNASATATYDAGGIYDIAYTATDSNTVGVNTITINKGTDGMAPVRMQVIEEAVYDRLYAASAAGYNTVTPPTAVQNREEMDSNSTQLAKQDTMIEKINALGTGIGSD